MSQIRVEATTELPFCNSLDGITVALSDLAVRSDKNILEERLLESPFVEFVWHIQITDSSLFVFPAVSHWGIVVARHNGNVTLSVIGPQTMAKPAHWPKDAELYGVSFRHGAYMPYLPPSIARDRRLVLPQATSKTFWLNGSAWQFPDYRSMDTFVERLARDDLLILDDGVTAALQGQATYFTARSLQYHFLRATGATRSFIRQVERARLAKALILRGTPIVDAASQTGYFDQAHLNRSLKRFVGLTSSQIGRRGRL